MNIHKEGRHILLGTLVVLLVLHFIMIKYFTINHKNHAIFTIITLFFYAFLLYFFRNPSRAIALKEHSVLSPADGKIVAIQEVIEEEYLKEKRIQISVFMSPLNVHVNRNPVSGLIKFFKHHPGKYLVACHPKSSTKNERTTIVVENHRGVEILFRQIAGLIARRIKFYPKQGSQVQQGNECGFIKFGSRADIFLPLDAQVKVCLGEKVTGGISVLAEI